MSSSGCRAIGRRVASASAKEEAEEKVRAVATDTERRGVRTHYRRSRVGELEIGLFVIDRKEISRATFRIHSDHRTTAQAVKPLNRSRCDPGPAVIDRAPASSVPNS